MVLTEAESGALHRCLAVWRIRNIKNVIISREIRKGEMIMKIKSFHTTSPIFKGGRFDDDKPVCVFTAPAVFLHMMRAFSAANMFISFMFSTTDVTLCRFSLSENLMCSNFKKHR